MLKKAKLPQNADALLSSLHNGLWVRITFQHAGPLDGIPI